VAPPGYLGFSFRCSDCGFQEDPDTDRSGWFFSGPLEVTQVDEGSPAAEAGIRKGDLVTEIDGHATTTQAAGERFARIQPGQRIRLALSRPDGTTAQVTLTPGERLVHRPELPLAPRAKATAVAPAPGVPPTAGTPGEPVVPTLRFTGSIGTAEVEVRGAPVNVTKLEEAGVLIIRSQDIEVRIRVREGSGGA
jgi:membrane-associated protease RseP (regulator of RpoE activity)